jgi:hypothetical protein
MEDFIEILEQRFNIIDKQVHYIVDDIKRESFMDNPDVLKIIN